MTHYKELDVIAVPEDVPEAGIKAGDRGTVVDVLGGGTRLIVDVVDPVSGNTHDLPEIDPGPPIKMVDRWRLEITLLRVTYCLLLTEGIRQASEMKVRCCRG